MMGASGPSLTMVFLPAVFGGGAYSDGRRERLACVTAVPVPEEEEDDDAEEAGALAASSAGSVRTQKLGIERRSFASHSGI